MTRYAQAEPEAPSISREERRLTVGRCSAMSKRESENYRVPEVSWRALRATDWRGALLVLLFTSTLILLGLMALLLGVGPELTVM